MSSQEEMRNKYANYLTERMGQQQAEQMIFQSPVARHCRNKREINSIGEGSSCTATLYSGGDTTAIKSMLQNSCRSTGRSSRTATAVKSSTAIKKGRLRKVGEIENNTCSICLDQYKERVQLPCKHSFCCECLMEWLNTSSRCPYCRTDCQYFSKDGEKFKIQQKQYEYEPPEEEEGEASLDFTCYMCEQTNEGDEVLICDGCGMYACHPRCDSRLRGRRVNMDAEWYCHFC